MKAFASLFSDIDATTKTNAKVAALTRYFQTAPKDDCLWCIALFSGRRPKRTITTGSLRLWAAEQAGIPDWLFEESYAIVGDLAETIALVLPPARTHSTHSLTHWITTLKTLSTLEETDRKSGILAAWDQLPPIERFLFNKLLTGGFRVGISQKLMTRALAQATGQDEATLTHKLMGNWTADTTTYEALIETDDPTADLSRPYPFYLAHPLDAPQALGDPADWFAEWKWDGIRGQLIKRGASAYLWSRGEDLITPRFPELRAACDFLPNGTVLDGEILAWSKDAPLPFSDLQKRLGRKTVPKSLLEQAPAILMAYDLLEWQGQDLRKLPFAQRRATLETMIAGLPRDVPLRLSVQVPFDTWDALSDLRAKARAQGTEGLMLKHNASPYRAGRKRGDWWKWKVDPMVIDAVMIYAQAGHGRRANLFSDFTFAVWDGLDLVPVTKAYSGLTDAEFRQITAWVRKNTLARFGPVRQVPPTHVFEIAFDGINASSRHKSGVALRFPRMSRWRTDKLVAEANTLDDLKALLPMSTR